MSNLLKHWFTGHDSALKSISMKPLRITTRDAMIVTALTLVATMVAVWLYTMIVGDWGVAWSTLALQTIATSMAAQYLYEYSGSNNMIAESSLRYAKGSTLSKYVSRREAIVYECLYKLFEVPAEEVSDSSSSNETKSLGDSSSSNETKSSEWRPKGKYRTDTVRRNFHYLLMILTHPAEAGVAQDVVTGARPRSDLAKYPIAAELIANIPEKTIPALNTISDHITEEIVYDILVNGFEDYTLATPTSGSINALFFSQLEKQNTARGRAIMTEVAAVDPGIYVGLPFKDAANINGVSGNQNTKNNGDQISNITGGEDKLNHISGGGAAPRSQTIGLAESADQRSAPRQQLVMSCRLDNFA